MSTSSKRLSGYAYRFISNKAQHKAAQPELTALYTFKSDSGHQYIVEIEHYSYHLYIIKFYLKAHSLSKYKFSLLTGNGHVRKIIYICINLLLDVIDKDSLAYFGFFAARSFNKREKYIEEKNYTSATVYMNGLSETSFLVQLSSI